MGELQQRLHETDMRQALVRIVVQTTPGWLVQNYLQREEADPDKTAAAAFNEAVEMTRKGTWSDPAISGRSASGSDASRSESDGGAAGQNDGGVAGAFVATNPLHNNGGVSTSGRQQEAAI